MASRNYILAVDIDGTINNMGQKFDPAKILTIEPMNLAKEVLIAFKKEGARIVYVTGRQIEEYREATNAWLDKHQFPDKNSIVFFSTKYGEWTWKSYVNYKVNEILKLANRHPESKIIVVDDTTVVLNEMKRRGFDIQKIQSSRDWKELKLRYLAQKTLF
ncbi:MAG: LNS2 domain-containing protein [Promethearchaeota archaeon]